MRRRARLIVARGHLTAFATFLALFSGPAASAQQRDPDNPTCPANPNWSTYPRMRFTEQQVDGRSVLLAEGQIDEATAARLDEALRSFRGNEIWMRSPGGDARAAEQAAMMIRQNGLLTHIPAGWACFSACTYMFLGGINRSIAGDGLLIVSMFTFTSDPNVQAQVARGGAEASAELTDIARASALRASEDNDFMIRMGVSRRFLTDIVYRQHAVATPRDPSTRRCLTLGEARRYNLVNDRPPAAAVPIAAPKRQSGRNGQAKP